MTDRDTFRDGWGPGSFDADDWRAGDRDYEHEDQRWRQNVDGEWINERGLLPGPLVKAAFWLAVGFATGVVGFVFGVMVVRAFL